MTAYQSTFQVIRAVADGRVAVGVLPMPQDGDSDPWWRHLLSLDAEAPRVVARLPFGPRGNARSDNADALVIGFGAQQSSGQDRTLLVTENAVQISRGRMVAAFSAIGLTCTFMVSCEHAEAANTLIEIDGFVPLDDPRLEVVARPARRRSLPADGGGRLRRAAGERRVACQGRGADRRGSPHRGPGLSR